MTGFLECPIGVEMNTFDFGNGFFIAILIGL